MKKGDDAKSTKDVKEGDGFTLSYLIIHMKILLLDSSWDLRSLKIKPIYYSEILQTGNDYTLALYQIF